MAPLALSAVASVTPVALSRAAQPAAHPRRTSTSATSKGQAPARLAVRASAHSGSDADVTTSGQATRRTVLLGASAVSSALAGFVTSEAQAEEFASPAAMKVLNRVGEVSHSDEEWHKILSDAQYSVLRKEATERPFSSPLNQEKRTGTFVCAGCSSPLFPSNTKYNSGTGWPSFYQPLPGAVSEVPDLSIFFMPRTEVRCAKCQGHLGHVFDDGPEPTHLRYCMNGLAMAFVPEQA